MAFEAKVNWDTEILTIKKMGSEGKSMAEIGRHYGLSRQRVKQVVDRYVPNWNDQYGFAIRRKAVADAKWAKWGDRDDSDLYAQQRAKLRVKASNAKRLGYEWDLKYTDVIWNTHCPVLGMELDYFLEYRQENSPTFDRIDSSKGYVAGNVHIISYRANRIKNDATPEELRKLADYLDNIGTVKLVQSRD